MSHLGVAPKETALGGAFLCRIDAAFPILTLSSRVRSGLRPTYNLRHRTEPITITANRPGLFAVTGRVDRYDGAVTLDLAEGVIREFWLRIPAEGAVLTWQDDLSRAASPTALPPVRFLSSPAPANRSDRPALRGLLDVGGTIWMQTVDVIRDEPDYDPITGTRVAAFDLRASIDCHNVDLPRAMSYVGDKVTLTLRLKVELDDAV